MSALGKAWGEEAAKKSWDLLSHLRNNVWKISLLKRYRIYLCSFLPIDERKRQIPAKLVPFTYSLAGGRSVFKIQPTKIPFLHGDH